MRLEAGSIIKEAYWGILAKIISLFVKPKPKHWVFASDYGNQYREGSKYFLEYMVRENPDFCCCFITRNPNVKAELDKKGIPCEQNFSFKGIYKIAQADSVFFTQFCDDIFFAYRNSNRRYYYMMHGMPIKRAYKATPESFKKKNARNISWIRRRFADLRQWLVLAFELDDINMISVCSEFNEQFMPLLFGDTVDVQILGMPRNDALFQPERMNVERWIPQAEGKFVITYMPTHRGYGRGDVTPTPFQDRPDVQEWMARNNVLFVMKNHPNMASKLTSVVNNDVICDVTKDGLDPQVVVYHSDVLISDYSSVWMDFLLLKRPILLYYYDDFETEEEGSLYNIPDVAPGHQCKTEQELFELIKKCKENYDSMCPSSQDVRRFHKYVDGNSCQRHFEYIINHMN